MKRVFVGGLFLLTGMVVLLAINSGSNATGEPLEAGSRCWLESENYTRLRSFHIDTVRLACVYGRAVVMPCQMYSPEGYPLRRATIKPDGRVKCVYSTPEGQ